MGLLRLLLALSVVVAHSWPVFGLSLMNGAQAVQCFYMVSGFYMALVLCTKYPPGRAGTLLFYTNRALRLLPTYWLVLGMSVAGFTIAGALGALQDPPIWLTEADRLGSWSRAALLIANVTLIGQDAVLFSAVDPRGGLYFSTSSLQEPVPAYPYLVIAQAWTLSLELVFYALAPFIVRRRLPVLLGLMVVSMVIRGTLLLAGWSNDPWSYRFFPSELVFFLMGALSCRVFVIDRRLPASPRFGALALVALVPAVLFNQSLWNYEAGWLGQRPWISVVTTVTFVGVALSLPHVFALTKNARLDRILGDLSYPIYLAHRPIIQFAFGLAAGTSASRLLERGTPWLMATAMVAAGLLVWMVERPLDGYRQGRAASRPPPAPSVRTAPMTAGSADPAETRPLDPQIS